MLHLETPRQSVNSLCLRWKTDINFIFDLALQEALSLWVEIYDVFIVPIKGESTTIDELQLKTKFEIKPLPSALSELKKRGQDNHAPFLVLPGYDNEGVSISAIPVNSKNIKIKPSDLYAHLEDVKAFEASHKIRGPGVEPGIKNNPQKIANQSSGKSMNKGGRRPGPLREAVKHLFEKFTSEGNTEILQAGRIDEFLARLKDSVSDGNRNFSDYIAERIFSVKKPGGIWKITTQERAIPGERYIEQTSYEKGDVSKILTDLRKQI